MLLRITKRPGLARSEQYVVFVAVVGRLFRSRRKALAAVLRAGWGRQTADRMREVQGVDLRSRAEQLSTDELEALARAIGPPGAR